jgi:hypothetical protein
MTSLSSVQNAYPISALPAPPEAAPRPAAPPPDTIAVPTGIGPGTGYIPVLEAPTVDVLA